MYRTYIQRIEIALLSYSLVHTDTGKDGREGVQLPDSLMDEAVLQSVVPRLETTQSPPWWQQTEEAVCRVGGITCNAEGYNAVAVLEGGERDTNDLLSCSHYPLKGLAAERIAGAIPHSDAASQNALDGASVEGAHDGGQGSGSSEFAEEVETLLCFLASAAVLLVQERSSVMCTPRNFVLLTLSTVAPLMVRGACWVCTLLKSTTISFVLSTFRERLLSLHHPARWLTSLL